MNGTVAKFRFVSVLGVLACALLAVAMVQQGRQTTASEPKKVASSDQYSALVQPLLKKYCLQCHSTKAKKGNLDLERFAAPDDIRKDLRPWQDMIEHLETDEMPPEGKPQPTVEERKQLIAWVRGFLDAEALARAGDPGPVLLRRLNNAEYTYTIRDLTGVDLDPAKEFPADGAAGEGFTNTGSGQAMSPALVQKYFDAGKEIAAHAVLLPDGFRFSRSTTRSDWTKETLAGIREIYRRHVETTDLGLGASVGVLNLHGDCRLGQLGRVPLEKYFAATISERDVLRAGRKSIAKIAAERGLNAKYLGLLWTELNSREPSLLLDALRTRWGNARVGDAASLADDVAKWQRSLWTYNPIGLAGRKGSRSAWQEPVDPLVTQQEIRFKLPPAPPGKTPEEVVVTLVATDAGDGNEHDFVLWRRPRLVADKQPDLLLRDIEQLQRLDQGTFGKHPDGRAIDAASICVQAPAALTLRIPGKIAAGRELVVTAELEPATGRAGSVQVEEVIGPATAKSGLIPSKTITTLSTVTALYPEHRTITFQRPLLIAPDSPLKARLIAALAAHRQLFPPSLCSPQIVPVDEVLTLTQFHREDEPLARLMLDEAQKQELDRKWDELRFIAQDPLKLSEVLDSLIETTKGHPQQGAFDSLIVPFRKQSAEFQKRRIELEPKHVDALVDFAARAYRRSLTKNEAQGLRGLYKKLRDQSIPHEDAFRLTLARVFASAAFLYRIEESRKTDEPKDPKLRRTLAHPVSDLELASRLSYFLWSSLPDQELRTAAEGQRLHKPDVLLAQTRRMQKSERVRRLAIEFACQWLHIRDFDQLNEKSEKHFPTFAALREPMYEESIRFFTDLFQNDGSVLSILDADHTFLNEKLAAHYGIPNVKGDHWRRVDGVRKYLRGGILAQAAVLSKQSGASRTNPILRGNFIFETLLGQRMPRPPAEVPQLPDMVPVGLSERALIEKHTSVAACAKCHVRIDPYGFTLESFDAIGRLRDKDTAGRKVDTQTTLSDGAKIDGLNGMREYLLTKRRDDFVRQFCRKLLGYSLGRAVQLSDEPLLNDMRERLSKNDYRFSVAVETIVLSDQFRTIRAKSVNP